MGTGFNKFIGDYDTLRPFLRLVSYSCYDKEALAQRLGQSTRSAEDNWARVCFCLPEEMLLSARQARREIHGLRSDPYQLAGNFLARTYQIKTLTGRVIAALIFLLQTLAAAKEPMRQTALVRAYDLLPISEQQAEAAPKVSPATVFRQLGELESLGILRRTMRGNALCYSMAEEPLAKLTADERRTLYYAIGFYRFVAVLSVPGYFLATTLRCLYPEDAEPFLPVQIKHSPITRILDDEVLHTIITAIEEQCAVTFSYRNRETIAVPQEIITDCHTGRQYMCAAVQRRGSAAFTKTCRFRIDCMERVAPAKPICAAACPAPPPHTLTLTLFYESERHRARLTQRIRARFPTAVFTEGAGCFYAAVEIADDLSLLPWIRTFHPWICIAADASPCLARRMRDDAEEALKNYGIQPALS